MQRYDPAGQAWTGLAHKPTPVSDVQAAVLGGRIYVPGGGPIRGEHGRPGDLRSTTGRLEEPAQPCRAVSAYALATFEGKLYLFGGNDGEETLKSAYRYDPALDAWEALPEMPAARASAGQPWRGRYLRPGRDWRGGGAERQ